VIFRSTDESPSGYRRGGERKSAAKPPAIERAGPAKMTYRLDFTAMTVGKRKA
jgi:hypothetical protein